MILIESVILVNKMIIQKKSVTCVANPTNFSLLVQLRSILYQSPITSENMNTFHLFSKNNVRILRDLKLFFEVFFRLDSTFKPLDSTGYRMLRHFPSPHTHSSLLTSSPMSFWRFPDWISFRSIFEPATVVQMSHCGGIARR